MDTESTPNTRRWRFDSLQQKVFLNLWRTYDRLRVLEDELFSRYDLTAQQYNAMRLLRGNLPYGFPTLELAGRLVSRAPDITRLLDKLEQRGLVARRRLEANRRVVLVEITPQGLELLQDLDKEVRLCNEKQLGHLSPEQLQQLTDLLQQARSPHEDPNGAWGVSHLDDSLPEAKPS